MFRIGGKVNKRDVRIGGGENPSPVYELIGLWPLQSPDFTAAEYSVMCKDHMHPCCAPKYQQLMIMTFAAVTTVKMGKVR
jgi:hypothetical protein